MDYLLSNPEQSCWVLDGYEEFHSKLTRQEVQRELLDPEQPLPVADLISGLLNRHLLPGCTVVVTCRARDVMDFEGILDKVGQLQGWDCHEIKEYVDNFFQIKGKNMHPIELFVILHSVTKRMRESVIKERTQTQTVKTAGRFQWFIYEI